MRRDAEIIVIADTSKAEWVLALGADRVIPRGESVLATLGHNAVDVVVDLVAGPQWAELIDILKRGGRHAVAGARPPHK